jgi:hypothetical protein
MPTRGLNVIQITEDWDHRKFLSFDLDTEAGDGCVTVIRIVSLTDEGEIAVSNDEPDGGHLFKLNGKNLKITPEVFEPGEENEGIVNFDEDGEISIELIYQTANQGNLMPLYADDPNGAYKQLVKHIQEHVTSALSGGAVKRRRSTRRHRRHRRRSTKKY